MVDIPEYNPNAKKMRIDNAPTILANEKDPYRYIVDVGEPPQTVQIRDDKYGKHTKPGIPDTKLRDPQGRHTIVGIDYEDATILTNIRGSDRVTQKIVPNEIGFGAPPHHNFVLVVPEETEASINVNTRKTRLPVIAPSPDELVKPATPSEKYIFGIYAPGIPPNVQKTKNIYSQE